jgi:hypothetical protein
LGRNEIGGNMIEVGEYVRFKDGSISRVTECRYAEEYKKQFDPNNRLMRYEKDKYWLDNKMGCKTDINIKKHSKNIIDLIEPGDLVRIFVEENVDENGTTEDTCVYEVTATQVKDFYGNKLEEIGIVGEDGTELIPFANVRGIVTREQFASMEYKVKEE